MPFGEAKVIIRAPLAIDGRPPAAGEQSQVYTTAVAGDYFRAMGVPLLKGRLFDPSDTATSRQVVVVSRSAAQQFWPGSDPVGSRVRFRFSGMTYDAEVVGVVGDVRHEALDRPAAARGVSAVFAVGVLCADARRAHGAGIAHDAQGAQGADLGASILGSRSSVLRTLDDWVSRTLDGRAFQPVPARRLRARDAGARDGGRVRRDELFHQPAHA